MAYAIGLDIGIASVGWAVVALDQEENPWGIINMGSRIFDKAEQPKTGESLAAPRRNARGMRRRLRRHRHRIERIKQLFINSKFLQQEELDNLYAGQLEDIYALRTKALDTDVTRLELARILLHLAQRRGFKSNRKSDAVDKEAGKLLSAVNANKKRMLEKGYRTVGEMFFMDDVFHEHKRNKSEDYLATVQRDMIEDEADKILARQMVKLSLNEDFKNKYLDIVLSQRSFAEGPGKGSKYGGDQVLKMVGKCTFELDKYRAPKASYSFERFNLLSKINHLRLVKDGNSRALDEKESRALIDLAYSTADLKFSKIRKELNVPSDTFFNMVRYDGADKDEAEKKTKFAYLKAYHEMRKALDKVAKNHIQTLSIEQLNKAAYALTVYKTDNKIMDYLQEQQFCPEDISAFLTISGFAKFGHLSTEACDKLIPYLEQGMNYDEACTKVGYDFKGHSGHGKDKYLPAQTDDMEEITSPVVRRAVSQTIKVINAIIREQHEESPLFLNIELARELSKNFDERNKIKKSQDENQARNERLMERIRTEFHQIHPTGMDLVKLKLWEEQDGISPYSQKPIEIARLFEAGYVDVDHIVPYSISFDDTYKNKVLVFSSENREKGNRLPLQWMDRGNSDKFIVWVNNSVRNFRKKQNLLKEKITEEDVNKFKQRNLQDTQHMSRFLYNYIQDYLQFAPSEDGRNKRVTAVSGAITSHLRKRWGINKNRANGDLHHAVDALVVSCTTQKMINEISKYSNYRETEFLQSTDGGMLVNRSTGEILKRFPLPWPDFRAELEARQSLNPGLSLQQKHLLFYTGKNLDEVKPLFVSRMPKHKVTGAAHKDTIKGVVDAQYVTVKRSLTDLKLDKEGEITNYFDKNSDILLYNALKEALIAAKGDAKKAFAKEFYKPKADGTQGPLVRKVKLLEKNTLRVPVHSGTAVADNDSMVRIDVFKVEGDGYYFVPIYVADTLKKQLPNKAVVANKPYEEWRVMEESNFIFSLYPSDLAEVEHKTLLNFTKINPKSDDADTYQVKKEKIYFVSADISSGSVTVKTHDGVYKYKGLGIKTLVNFEKYQVDVLGNYSKVKREVRKTFC